MTPNDFNQKPEPPGEADPLSATGMFLRAFDSTAPAPPSDQAAAPFSAPNQPPVAKPQPSGPGEFTRIFQGLEARPAKAPAPQPPQPRQAESQPDVFLPATPIASSGNPFQPHSTPLASSPEAHPSSAPGEFTRISVSPAPIPAAPVAKTTIEPLPAQPASSAPPRLKGFSSPGVSDSASADGSFTQFFKAAPAKPAATQSPQPAPYTPVQPVQAKPVQPSPIQSGPVQAQWEPRSVIPPPARNEKQSNDGLGAFAFGSELNSDPKPTNAPSSQPAIQDNPSSATGSSATGMMSSFGSQASPAPAAAVPEPRQPVLHSYQTEPLPSYRSSTPTPATPASEPKSSESGSVTQLIQRLSQTPRDTPKPTPVAAPPSDSGPGEFTRMISGIPARAEQSQPATAPAPASPGFSAPAMPPIAMPAVPKPPAITPPAFHAPAPSPAAPHIPAMKVEMPAMAVPKPTPPAIAAPQAKLPAMVPILLVVNTFLLVVLLVVVIFAMRK